MRYLFKPLPKDGDTRIKRKFLLLPKFIGYEMRWLEYTAYKEVYSLDYEFSRWIPTCWVD